MQFFIGGLMSEVLEEEGFDKLLTPEIMDQLLSIHK